MLMKGVDYHPSFQQVAFLDQDTGERGELRLSNADGEAERFYRGSAVTRNQGTSGDRSHGVCEPSESPC